MRDVLFVQFKEHTNLRYGKGLKTILGNGLSSVYEECKNLGDFFWADFQRTGNGENTDLPITEGTVYVSTIFADHIMQALIWAHKFPKVQFIVGGKGVTEYGFVYKGKFLEILPTNVSGPKIQPPSNIRFTKETAEREILGKCLSDKPWHIELPEDIEDVVTLSYPADNSCYWGKCLFCEQRVFTGKPLERSFRGLQFPDLNNYWAVWLASPALSPAFLLDELQNAPMLGNRYRYYVFLRADQAVLKVLDQAIQRICLKNDGKIPVIFHVGVECPSNRMLKMMGKGTTTDIMLKVFEIFAKYNCKVRLYFILLWNVLTSEDVEEAGKFSKELKNLFSDRIQVTLFDLKLRRFGQPETEFEKVLGFPQLDVDVAYKFGKLECKILFPILDKEQLALNLELYNVYKENFDCIVNKRTRKFLGV